MIKYLGSKRLLVPVLGQIFSAVQARTALDGFTGTTRVAQEYCRRGGVVTCVDLAAYSQVLAQCYVETDSAEIDGADVEAALEFLAGLPDMTGYVTETFCEQARYFHPDNGRRIDAIRQGIDDHFPAGPLRPILLTSLMEAADSVDSTVGIQMAYLKHWAPRACRPLRLRIPELTPSTGTAIRGDITALAATVGEFDLAYLDPPYNQHSYFANYHVWETLIRWDKPEHYGVARKRIDARIPEHSSAFNRRKTISDALRQLIFDVRARVLVVSFNDEGFVPLADLQEMLQTRGHRVLTLEFDGPRYVGARIGIYSPSGEKVGTVGRLRNVEYVLISAPEDDLAAITEATAVLSL